MEVHTLSLNDFNRPKVLTGNDAGYVAIIHLIYLEKGKFQSHPDMGVGIRSRYRFNSEENILDELQQDIRKQIEQYLPELGGTGVVCEEIDQGLVVITINTNNGGVYVLEYDTNTTNLTPAEHTLESLKKFKS